MRVKFPEGSGGPFLVPGVGPVNGGEPFDWPDSEPPVAGAVREDGSPITVPPDPAAAEQDAGETGGEDGGGPGDETAPGRKASSGKGSAR